MYCLICEHHEVVHDKGKCKACAAVLEPIYNASHDYIEEPEGDMSVKFMGCACDNH